MSGFRESPSRLRYYREHPIVDMRNFAQLPFASKPDAPARESGDDLWVTDCVFPCLRSGLGWSTSNILGKSGRERISPRVILGKADSIHARPLFPYGIPCGALSPRCLYVVSAQGEGRFSEAAVPAGPRAQFFDQDFAPID